MNILLFHGGNSSEFEISVQSANYLKECLQKNNNFKIFRVEIGKDLSWKTYPDQLLCELSLQKTFKTYENNNLKNEVPIDYAIPCIHGSPGETGDLQSYFEMINLPYLGSNPETSKMCFNKATTKLWMSYFNIPNTPSIILEEQNSSAIQKAQTFLEEHQKVFIKATNEGSSVGCYRCQQENASELKSFIEQAFQYSPYVLIEKCVEGREFEVSGYEYQNNIIATAPGEIICPGSFYSYDEKYSKDSQTTTHVEAKNLSDEQVNAIKKYTKDAFKVFKVKDLARFDFFMSHDGTIYLNEINTFPGMTSISLFAKMMENTGLSMTDFLNDRIQVSQ